MGVRFACHSCGKRLNIKRDLAGKRGVCPACQIRFRIPNQDADHSFPIDTAIDAAIDTGVENPSGRDSESSIGVGMEPSASVGDVHAASALTNPSALPKPSASTNRSTSTDPPKSMNPPASAGQSKASTGKSVSLAMIDGDDAATWYVRPPTGGQYGPADTEMLRQWIDQGRVASSSLLWRDGWPQWRSAVEALPEFADTLAAADAPPQTDIQNTPAKKNESTKAKPAALSGDAKVGTKRSRVQAKRYGLIGGLAAMTIGLCAVLVYLLWR